MTWPRLKPYKGNTSDPVGEYLRSVYLWTLRVLDGDTLDITFSPVNYTRALVSNLTTSLEELTSHLQGIDSQLATFAAGLHAASHKRGGTDQIDGDLLDVDYSPSNYTRTTGSNGTTSTEELTSHLKGIDLQIASLATTAHAATHIRGGADQVDGDLIDVDYSPTNYTRTSGANGTTSTEELTSHLTGIDTALGLKAPLLLPQATYTASVTLQLSDAFCLLLMNKTSAAQSVTIPPNSGGGSVAFAIGTVIAVLHYSTQALTYVAGSGVTIRSKDTSLTSAGQYGMQTLIKLGTNEWSLSGSLA